VRAIVTALAAAFLTACGSVSTLATAPPSTYVPWVPLPPAHVDPMPPPAGTPIAVPPGTPSCLASQLEGRMIGRYSNMSNPDAPVVLRNAGGSACSLEGFPDLAVLDPSGRTLDRVSGATGIGTYYDSTLQPVPVLMEPGTAPLDTAVDWGHGQGLKPGQAFFNVEWIGCTLQRAATLVIGLPGGGGRFSIRFDTTTNGLDVCSHDVPLRRGPFDPTGISWNPDRHLLDVEATISMPVDTVKRGTTLVYFVTLRNRSAEDYVLKGSCPDFWEGVTAEKMSPSFELNCAPVGTISPGESVTFQMKLDVHAGITPGPTTLLWNVFDRRVIADYPSAQITIT